MGSLLFADVYVVLATALSFLDIVVAIKSFLKRNSNGRFLGLTCIFSFLVALSYFCSVLANDSFVVSLMSSFYFLSIDYMLVSFVMFLMSFTKIKPSKSVNLFKSAIFTYLIFETIIFIINPFNNFVISFTALDRGYRFEMNILYYMHLVYSYFMVVIIFAILLKKMFSIAKEYRKQYLYIIIGIFFIVLVNGIYIFLPQNTIDYSIVAYCLVAFIVYWSCFNYSKGGMLNKLKGNIFDNMDQGIVLFDYSNMLILNNVTSVSLLQNVNFNNNLTKNSFLNQLEIDPSVFDNRDKYSIQCYVDNGDIKMPLRCDFRKLHNKKNQLLGQLFVINDAEDETDILTGFQLWESFKAFVRSGAAENYVSPATAIVLDINNLSLINATHDQKYGDKKIRELADLCRHIFPQGSYFIRGIDANIIIITYTLNAYEIRKCLNKISDEFSSTFQYSYVPIDERTPNVLTAIEKAHKAMKTKKLLDAGSTHSQMLNSLVRALKECDDDTEMHVERTQELGEKLGVRLGLSDDQQSDLALLCLLHDIGKIGIPLDILNKPGKLSDEEWQIIRSHVEKGYQIAMSSKELSGIADMIRHHHERWDGNGYPDGLSRESIPYLSRVIAVVDSYDAMVSDRSYRKAMTVEQAKAELKRCAGTQFDPLIVSEFIKMLDENPEIYNSQNVSDVDVSSTSSSNESMEIIKNSNVSNVHEIKHSRYVLDKDMVIVSIDEMFTEITEYTQEDLRRLKIKQIDLIPDEDKTEYLRVVNECMAKQTVLYFEHKLKKKSGEVVYVFCYGKIFYNSAVREMNSEITICDSSSTHAMKMLLDYERDRANIRLKNWESTYRCDSLTGLLTHEAFKSDVELQLLNGDKKVLLLMMDLDKFKVFNDTYGHHAGDEYLILTSQSITSTLRKDDLACRMGGDEFAIALFVDADVDDETIYDRAAQIYDKIAMGLKSSNNNNATMSMGIAMSNDKINTFNLLYEAADKALYNSKETGRAKWTIYSE